MDTQSLDITMAGDSEHPLYSHFSNRQNMANLIKLYLKSESENMRGGKLEQQVGSSREKDLIASLKSNPELLVDYDIHPTEETDVKVNHELISIKHMTHDTAQSIKLKWIGGIEEQQEFIDNHAFTHNMLIAQVAFKKNFVKIAYIDVETMERLRKQFIKAKLEVLSLKKNAKGVAMTTRFYNALKAAARVKAHCILTNHPPSVDPIQERLNLLSIESN